MIEPTAAWERGERRRTRTIAVLTAAVVLLALAVSALAGLALEQRVRLTDLGSQNDELTVLLNGRTPIIEHIDEAVTRIECLIEKQAVLLVGGVVVLLDDDDPAALVRLEDLLAELEEAVAGICEEGP